MAAVTVVEHGKRIKGTYDTVLARVKGVSKGSFLDNLRVTDKATYKKAMANLKDLTKDRRLVISCNGAGEIDKLINSNKNLRSITKEIEKIEMTSSQKGSLTKISAQGDAEIQKEVKELLAKGDKDGILKKIEGFEKEAKDSGLGLNATERGSKAKLLFPRGDKLSYEIFIKQDEIALNTYTKLRKTGLDVNEINVFARNTGLDIDTVRKLKEHIFLTEHGNLLNYETKTYFSDYFQPDTNIAYGWEKALQGELSDVEKNWFKQLADHELAESKLMKQGEPYRTIESIDSTGMPTGNPPGAHDKAPKPPGDFPGFIPKF